MPLCKLCGEEKKLVDAHILPRAFWQLPLASEQAAKLMSNIADDRPAKTLKGVYDSGILCEACDLVLGRLDQHASESLLQGRNFEPFFKDGLEVGRHYTEADANIISQFIASVAWRASISSHRFYKSVRLGPYEAAIAAWLRDESDMPEGIGTVMAEFDQDDVPMLDPHKTRTDGVRYWVLYGDRFVFYLKADKRATPQSLRRFALEETGVVMTAVRKWQGSKERAIMQNIAGRNPNAFGRPNRR